MTALLKNDVWARLGWSLVLPILGLVLLGGPGQGAQAQAVEDTSQTRPAEVEPAAPDFLPTEDLASSLQAPADTEDVERAYVNADSLSTRQRGGERIQEMFGDVFVRQDTTRVRSQYALRYLNRDEVLFTDDVVIYERGDTLRADTVRYDRATEVGRARGHVRLTNGDVQVRSERATYYASEKRSVFPDSVTLVDSSRVLRARSGTYWSDDGRAEFGGGVRLTEPGTELFSDSLTYYRDQDRSIARGDVFVDRQGQENAQADTTNRTYLFGDRVDNQEARRYSRVEGNALLVRVRLDSTGAPTDTLVVDARRLEAFRTDTHRRLVAVSDVCIWQPDLAAVADSAVYDRVVAATPDSALDQDVPIDTTRPAPDSLTIARDHTAPDAETLPPQPPRSDSLKADAEMRSDSTAGRARLPSDTTDQPTPTEPTPIPDSVERPRLRSAPGGSPRQWNTPTATSDSALPLEETRLFRSPMTWFENSQVWGDSIRIRSRNRSIDTVFVRGAGFAAQRDSVLDRIQQLKAQNIVAFFTDGSLRRIRARPTARAIRFLAAENDSLNGAARTSGDRIELRFAEGRVKRISVVGGTQTTYYRKNENIPDPFELEGFQWTPDRRPTRAGLLRDERVQRRLDLDPTPRSEPVAGPPSRRSSASASRSLSDSTAQSSRRTSWPALQPATSPSWPWVLTPGADAADSLRHDGPVLLDSMWSEARLRAPADTSATKPNPNP